MRLPFVGYAGMGRWLASWQDSSHPHPPSMLGSRLEGPTRLPRAVAAAVCLPCVLISVNSDMTGSVEGRRDNGLLWDHTLCPCKAQTGKHTRQEHAYTHPNLHKQTPGKTVLPLLVLFLSHKHPNESENMNCAKLICRKLKWSLLK